MRGGEVNRSIRKYHGIRSSDPNLCHMNRPVTHACGRVQPSSKHTHIPMNQGAERGVTQSLFFSSPWSKKSQGLGRGDKCTGMPPWKYTLQHTRREKSHKVTLESGRIPSLERRRTCCTNVILFRCSSGHTQTQTS